MATSATLKTPVRGSPFPIPKTAVRTASGQSAPRLKKAPVFSTYSRRNVSARNDRLGPSESVVAATCLVTRSQPMVAPIAMSKASRTPILVIIALRVLRQWLDVRLVPWPSSVLGVRERSCASWDVEPERRFSGLVGPARARAKHDENGFSVDQDLAGGRWRDRLRSGRSSRPSVWVIRSVCVGRISRPVSSRRERGESARACDSA